MIEEKLPRSAILEGELQDLSYADAVAKAEVATAEGTVTVTARFVFGCDGSRSAVRESLVKSGGQLAKDFEQQVLDTPSSGLTYKAMLVRAPADFLPSKLYIVQGKSGKTLTFLPFSGGEPGKPRLLAKAGSEKMGFNSFRTSDDLYKELRKDFPQLNVDEAFDKETVANLSASSGSIFPKARWCRKATAWIDQVGVALLGDALHSFPPDIAQGVNSGLVDVRVLLECWPRKAFSELSTSALKEALDAFDRKQAPEAEAVCKLIPIGMPYQYFQAGFFGKLSFFSSLIVRMLAWKTLPSLFSAPVIFAVTSKPALPYTEILEKHHANTRRLVMMLALPILVLTIVRKLPAPRL